MTDSPDEAEPTGDPAADDLEQLHPDSTIRQAVLEVEAHAHEAGWDTPPQLFALVRLARIASAAPADQLAAMGIDVSADADSYVPVLQDDVTADDLERQLEAMTWPGEVDGCAVVLERLMLPPTAEEAMPDDADAAAAYAASHPERSEVRIAVGVARDGEAHCAVRLRPVGAGDDAGTAADGGDATPAAGAGDGDLLEGPDLVPGLVRLLTSTLTH